MNDGNRDFPTSVIIFYSYLCNEISINNIKTLQL